MSQFHINTTELGSETGLRSRPDCELAQLSHSFNRVSAVEGSEQYKVKEEIVTQDGQSSEEEVEEDFAESENYSILPSSVLDKVSVIAEHFLARRSSGAPDELWSPHRTQQEGTLRSPREEMGTGSDRYVCRRKDSTLSKQEQLLIGKIRSYYENAEQKDEGFSLMRRESLTHIPSGLVRTSVSHFNKIPHADHQINPPNTETALMISSPASSDLSPNPEKLGDLFRAQVDSSVRHKSEEVLGEDFRSPAEMIKVWQEMEKDVTNLPRKHKFRDLSRFRETCSVSQSFSRNTAGQVREQPPMTADDLGTIKEESPVKVKHCCTSYLHVTQKSLGMGFKFFIFTNFSIHWTKY